MRLKEEPKSEYGIDGGELDDRCRRKVREPILSEQIKKYNWTMIGYEELKKLLGKHKKLKLDDLTRKLISLVDFKLEVQESMHKFLTEPPQPVP